MSSERTEGEKYVAERMNEMLGENTPYRAGALFLTYPSPDGDGCRQAQVAAFGKMPLGALGQDYVALVDGMQGLAQKAGRDAGLWKPLDTTNRNLVTAHGVTVVMMKLPDHAMTATHALQLAAWLIAAVKLAGFERAMETAIATVEAIESV